MINSAVSFNILALSDNANNHSSTAVLPAVFERELNIVFTEVTTYHLRLVREGNILYGVAERVVPGMTHGVSGSIIELANGQKSLQLTIYTTTTDGGTGLSLTLMARVNNDALLTVSGKAYGLFDNSTAPLTGTFSFSPPVGAQF